MMNHPVSVELNLSPSSGGSFRVLCGPNQDAADWIVLCAVIPFESEVDLPDEWSEAAHSGVMHYSTTSGWWNSQSGSWQFGIFASCSSSVCIVIPLSRYASSISDLYHPVNPGAPHRVAD
jgi:hypothetical protein